MLLFREEKCFAWHDLWSSADYQTHQALCVPRGGAGWRLQRAVPGSLTLWATTPLHFPPSRVTGAFFCVCFCLTVRMSSLLQLTRKAVLLACPERRSGPSDSGPITNRVPKLTVEQHTMVLSQQDFGLRLFFNLLLQTPHPEERERLWHEAQLEYPLLHQLSSPTYSTASVPDRFIAESLEPVRGLVTAEAWENLTGEPKSSSNFQQ